MILYTIIGLTSVLLAYLQKYYKFGLNFSFLLITAFFAIRYQFGSDYEVYLEHFYSANEGDLDYALYMERMEYGWIFLCRLFSPIGFFGMVIVLTIIEHLILYLFIKKHVPPQWYWLAIFSYLFSSTLCLTGLSMMRQFLAICICLCAFDLALKKKNVIWSILLVIFAASFHTSAYICLPFCFIGFWKDVIFSKSFAIAIFIFLVAGGAFMAKLLGEYLNSFVASSVFDVYENWLDRKYTGTIGVSTFFNYFLIFLILINQRKQNPAIKIFVIMLLAHYFIDMFSTVAPLIGRIGLYFYILFPICFANVISKIPNKTSIMLVVVLFIVFRLYGCYSFITSPGWGQSFLLYQTIFSVEKWM